MKNEEKGTEKRNKDSILQLCCVIRVEFSALALDAAGQFKAYHRHMISYWVG